MLFKILIDIDMKGRTSKKRGAACNALSVIMRGLKCLTRASDTSYSEQANRFYNASTHVFRTVAHHLSYTKAAEVLYL